MKDSRIFNRLKGLRVERGLTQRDMAELLSMNVDTYRKKENGKREFTLSELAKVKEKLDIDLDYYFFYIYSNRKVTKKTEQKMGVV